MDELFRFVALRTSDLSFEGITVDGQSPLAVRLSEARAATDGREKMQRLARAFVASEDFVTAASTFSVPLERLADALETTEVLDLTSVEEAISRSLDSAAADLVDSPRFSGDVERLQDSVLAFKLAPPDDGHATTALRLLRAAEVVKGVASGRQDFNGSMQRLVIVPASVLSLPAEPATDPERRPAAPDEGLQLELVARAEALGEALRAVRSAANATDVASQRDATPRRVVDRPVAKGVGFPEMSNGAGGLVLSERAISTLAPAVLETLSGLDIDLATSSVPQVLHVLGGRFIAATGDIEASELQPGGAVHRLLEIYGPLLPVTVAERHDDANDPAPVTLAGPPATHGQVRPAGWADLLVVRQHVLGYSPGEVAYVENVAKGEKLTRATRRSEATEDATVTVRETSREQERDVQATDRFDLQTESTAVLRSDAQRQAGNPVSGSYGLFVETSESSKENTQRQAETFGRNVTTRALGRITERVRTESLHRTVREFSEAVTHEVDNRAGADREVFVYQWLDRLVQTQVFSYGKRLFYDLVLPEPAALLLRALIEHRPDGPPVKPAPFTLDVSELTEFNYLHYVAGYGVTGVAPPPEPQRVVSTSFAKRAQNVHASEPDRRQLTEVESAQLPIPAGYRAVEAKVHTVSRQWDGTDGWLALQVGLTGAHLTATPNPTLPLSGEVGEVPVTLLTANDLYIYAVNVEIICEPTERTLSEWRQRTYDAILAASIQRISDYEQRAANLRAAMRMEALSFTPERKRSTERSELQRACLAVLTNQQFDGLSAVGHSPEGFPQPFLPNIEPVGRYVRFLQQAFEWEQMTWRYYPYFWGRKPYWLDKLLLDDDDAQFRDFLQAGSARTLVPVRPGFEGAVAHFMETGDVPRTEELGQIAGALYVPFLAEGPGVDVAMDRAVPYGDAWEMRAPTTLVRLRADATVPSWSAAPDADGRLVWSAEAGEAL